MKNISHYHFSPFSLLNNFIILLLTAILLSGCNQNDIRIKTAALTIIITTNDAELWHYKQNDNRESLCFSPPVFEIDGKTITAQLSNVTPAGDPVKLRNGVTEYTYSGKLQQLPDLTMTLRFRVSDRSSVVRFTYELSGSGNHRLTKEKGSDMLEYFTATLPEYTYLNEIRFSEFNEMVHSFCLSERAVSHKDLADSLTFMGPMISAGNNNTSFLFAYEHGSQVPDRFLQYAAAGKNRFRLSAVKGNYYRNFLLDANHPFQSIWFETALVNGDENKLAASYRNFMLHDMSENTESRKPYIFYNTWNFQERNRNWFKKPYLADMTLPRMLKEIDAAHTMGIEVFVIDAGWFEKTGDWQPSLKRFPDSLRQVKARLDQYGMKMGLWFNPTVAAVSSNMYKDHSANVRTMNGNKGNPWPVWETEESYGMCLVSAYRDAFADKLIELNKTLGVTYFKWDAIGQYECNDPHHYHGDSTNTPQERLENYAFEIGRYMSYVVDKLAKACPEAIVDFDITEGGRTVGLSFLSSGKYFLINNGPYYFNYNIPFDQTKDNWNIFFFPGPARGWICRTPLTFDKWIPTSLFLTHYLPDDPYENQTIAVGSLIMGQNGIWGDLPAISENGLQFFHTMLGYYKQVRDDMTSVSMIRDGAVGGSPEIYEKINPTNGKGAIVVFSSHPGHYSYVSKNKVNSSFKMNDGVKLRIDAEGHAIIDTEFKKAEAKLIFFGIR